MHRRQGAPRRRMAAVAVVCRPARRWRRSSFRRDYSCGVGRDRQSLWASGRERGRCEKKQGPRTFAVRQDEGAGDDKLVEEAARRGQMAPDVGDVPNFLSSAARAVAGERRGWDVPWGGWTLAGGLGGWVVSFLGVSAAMVALAPPSLLSNPTAAVGDTVQFIVLQQLLTVVSGIAVIYLAVRPHLPLDPQLEVFVVDFSKPFDGEKGWLLWALVYYVIGFASIAAVGTTLELAGWFEKTQQGRGTVDEIAQLLSPEAAVVVGLLAITSIGAPLLEEVVFRGFLLTTLTKWMKPETAVLVSAGIFACSHLSAKDLPQLFTLGTVLGFSYLRTRNLLTSMTVHALWNSVVVVALVGLSLAGYDVNSMVHGGTGIGSSEQASQSPATARVAEAKKMSEIALYTPSSGEIEAGLER